MNSNQNPRRIRAFAYKVRSVEESMRVNLVTKIALCTHVVWAIFIAIVFMLPPNELVLWTMVALTILLAAYWFASVRHRFRGPATS